MSSVERSQQLPSFAVRPSRLNLAGWCLYCLTQNCTSARCIEMHAGTVWEVCRRCGGSEYVNGHRDRETAVTRCNCFGGLIEPGAQEVAAEVIELRPERVRRTNVPAPTVVSRSGQVYYAGH
ncbi:hypothetical protein AB0H49_28705 [Nocardia sp. NPDC050713]|uniref:hypothetical protein n=1 Tax=Nocardia sp. NPDC050713 TaxID=3154511 RepID=UPI00340D1A6A